MSWKSIMTLIGGHTLFCTWRGLNEGKTDDKKNRIDLGNPTPMISGRLSGEGCVRDSFGFVWGRRKFWFCLRQNERSSLLSFCLRQNQCDNVNDIASHHTLKTGWSLVVFTQASHRSGGGGGEIRLAAQIWYVSEMGPALNQYWNNFRKAELVLGKINPFLWQLDSGW